ncbi:MAG: glycosyltransferase family 2 protein [Micromonosporaceae bacterium]|nr:glycosyltransferase family 2 protein [Micromonosporaceae bacterium]
MRLVRAAGRHWLFLVLFTFGLALRVLASIAYRPAIFFTDSLATYLYKLPSLDPTGQNPVGYDILLLKPVLAIGNLFVAVVVQHALALAMAAVGYALAMRLGAWRWLAALGVAPVLLDAYQVQIEQNLMADTLFEAMLVAALAVLAWPVGPGRPRVGWRRVLAAGLVLGAAVTVRQVGEPMFIPLVAFVALVARGWRTRILLTGLAVASFALPVLGYATWYHHFTGRYDLTGVAGVTMYGRLAPVADCNKLNPPYYEVWLCPAMPAEKRAGPDWWAHDPSSPLSTYQPPDGSNPSKRLNDFNMRVIRGQPLDVARAVLADAVQVFQWGRPTWTNPDAWTERWRFQTFYPTYPPLVTVESITELTDQYGGGDPTVVVPVGRFLRWYQMHLGTTPGPVIALSMLAALAGALRRSQQRAPALLFLGSAVAVLFFADLFEFSWRYQLPGYVLLPVAGVLGATGLLRRRPAPQPAPAFPEPADEAALAEFAQRYGEPDLPEVVVLIAAYQEERGIGPVLASVPEQCCGQRLAALVVVDGGGDRTAEVARDSGAYVCAVPVNRGQGAALRLGYHLARTHGARYIVTTDADGQYDMAELPALLEPLICGEADFVTGSRALGANESTDRVRRLGTRVFALIVTLLTRHRVTDTSFGFRAMRAEVTAEVTLTQPQYQSSELLIGVLRRGYRVVERPMTMRQRSGGTSKKGRNLSYGWRYTRVVFSTWARERSRRPGRDANTTRSSNTNLTRNSVA